MSREKLPERRTSENFTFDYYPAPGSLVSIDVSFGRDEAGAIKEVFVTTRKVGTNIDIMARDIAVLMSFLLQYGCDPKELLGVLSADHNGKPEGLAGQIASLIAGEQS